jgi:hypothetical protein
VLATLQPGNEFWINISKLPTDKAYWNDSDYFHISISGDGFFNGPQEGGYSFYDRWHFIRGTWYPGTPEWLRKIIPDNSRLIWDDWISNFQDHSEYGYSDPEPTFINTDTIIGFHVKNGNMSLSTEWNKKSGALTYYHYTGTAVAGQLPLDLEFVLKSDVHSGINTSVEPEKLILAQNFPNPFTSSTVIEYSIPKAAFVSLKVYDISGRKVTTLVEENKQPGKYQVSWNASKIPGGVFFYRLQSGSYTESKSLLLLK